MTYCINRNAFLDTTDTPDTLTDLSAVIAGDLVYLINGYTDTATDKMKIIDIDSQISNCILGFTENDNLSANIVLDNSVRNQAQNMATNTIIKFSNKNCDAICGRLAPYIFLIPNSRSRFMLITEYMFMKLNRPTNRINKDTIDNTFMLFIFPCLNIELLLTEYIYIYYFQDTHLLV